MFILGLTGSIAMGKSTLAKVLRRWHIPVHDADATVHALMAPKGKAVPLIEKRFPGVMAQNGAIDRQTLGRQVLEDETSLRDLEAILHPLVRAQEKAFLRQAARRRERLVVLDIPLLFETGAEKRCDAIMVVSAPAFLQRQRVLRRPGMTEEKLEAILKRQTDDRLKRRKSDIVILTGIGYFPAIRQLRSYLKTIR